MINGYEPWVESYNGGLRLCVRYKDEFTGKIRKVSTKLEKCTKKAQAEAEKVLLQKIKSACTRTDNADMTLNDLIEAYSADMKNDTSITESTYKRNTIACGTMSRIIGGDVLLSKLPKVDILAKLNATGERAETKNERLKRFKTLILWGYRHGYIDNVMFLERLERFKCAPHKESISEKYLETYEYIKVRDALTIEGHKLFLMFLVLTGARCGEAIALTKDDVDIENMCIRVNKTYDSNEKVLSHAKTLTSVREIHIQPQLLEVLRQIEIYFKRMEIRTGKRSKLLFHNEDGDYYSYYAFRKALALASEKAIGRKITPHATRHTHASLLFEQGFTIDEVQHRLGHADSKVTRDVYLHVTHELRERENRKLDKFRIG